MNSELLKFILAAVTASTFWTDACLALPICSPSQQTAKSVLAAAESLPPFPGRRVGYKKETKIGQLTDGKENLFLFRGIVGTYKKKFTDHGNGYIEKEKNAYSYSLNPNVPLAY
ncbi:MAG: hypothetical protein EOP04_20220, partial [Proteobacteria bacterium]